MKLPGFGLSTLDGARSDTRNTQLAATLAAFDVPLKKERPFSTSAGDGIRGVRVTWHFETQGARGHDTKRLVKRWVDPKWMADHPKETFAKCRQVFGVLQDFKDTIHGREIIPRYPGGTGKSTADTKQAACMVVMGHPCRGYTKNGDVFFWHFGPEADADLALYDREDLCEALPTEDIAYLRATLVNHMVMVAAIKQVQLARVEHGGRVLAIGRNASPQLQGMFEKLLYRK